MMHVGDVKGRILDSIVVQHQPKKILELGTYCGYSAIRMARLIPADGVIYTVDPYPLPIEPIFIKAGVADKVKRLQGKAEEVIPKFTEGPVDLVFIDHDKASYLDDLKLLEKYNILRRGTVVVADNVVYHGIQTYLDHVRNSGLYSSVLYKATLEYHNEPDGVEVSIYK